MTSLGDGGALGGPPPGGWPPPGPTRASGAPGPAYAGKPPPPPPDPSGWTPPTAYAAHKPGAVPLRPLGLGDLLDAAFTIVRHNPGATVGSAVLVAGVAMLIPVAVSAVLTWTVGLSVEGNPGLAGGLALVAAYGSLVLGAVLQWLGNLLVTGMNAHVVLAAATGRTLSLPRAWAATRGRRWRLVGLTVLLSAIWLLALGLVGAVAVGSFAAFDLTTAIVLSVLLVIGTAVVSAVFWIRVSYLAVPPLMLEDVSIGGALGRARDLTRGQFWRTFGIAVLTLVMASFVGGIVSTPVGLVGQLALVADPGGVGFLLYTLATALGQVVAAALVTPFVTTVVSLQYLDQRIRREAFDVELLRRSGMLER